MCFWGRPRAKIKRVDATESVSCHVRSYSVALLPVHSIDPLILSRPLVNPLHIISEDSLQTIHVHAMAEASLDALHSVPCHLTGITRLCFSPDGE
jgi:hypothetical protein